MSHDDACELERRAETAAFSIVPQVTKKLNPAISNGP
jgi:hypothetical protein